MGYFINAFQLPIDMFHDWMMERKNRKKARYYRKLDGMKRRMIG